MTREDGVFNLLANGEIRLAEAGRLLGWPRWKMRRRARGSSPKHSLRRRRSPSVRFANTERKAAETARTELVGLIPLRQLKEF